MSFPDVRSLFQFWRAKLCSISDVFLSVFGKHIEISHSGATDLLKRDAIRVARSFVPGSRCPVDKTIKETFMKHSRSHGGTGGGSAGLLSNYDAYQRWVRASHERVQFVKGALAWLTC